MMATNRGSKNVFGPLHINKEIVMVLGYSGITSCKLGKVIPNADIPLRRKTGDDEVSGFSVRVGSCPAPGFMVCLTQRFRVLRERL